MPKISLKSFLLALLALLTIFSAYSPARDFRWKKKISEGIDYIHIKKFAGHGWIHVYILKIDLQRGDIDVRPALAKDTIGALEPTHSIAKRSNAVAAINGSFFDGRRKPPLPVGIISIDGKMVNKSILPRCAFGITQGKDVIIGIPRIESKIVLPKKNKSFDIWGINRPRKNDEIILYTNEYGDRTKTNQFGIEIMVRKGKVSSILRAKGNSSIPKDGYVISLHGKSRRYADWMKKGDYLLVEFNLGKGWQMVDHMVSGGPLLIKDGKMVVKKMVIEEFFRGKLLKRSARTAIGETKDKKLMFVVVDKRRGISNGVFYSELSNIMLKEGAWNAMGLDGGGSSTMYVDGRIVNYPTAGSAIPVSNAIVVKKTGWRLLAKKPAKIPSPIKEISVEATAISSLEVSEVMPSEDGLIQIYNLLVKPLFTTTTREVVSD